MSQQTMVRKRPHLLYNEIGLGLEKPQLKTSALQTNCNVCGMRLEDGISLTAKTIQSGTLFFCEFHYPRLKSKN